VRRTGNVFENERCNGEQTIREKRKYVESAGRNFTIRTEFCKGNEREMQRNTGTGDVIRYSAQENVTGHTKERNIYEED